MKSIIRRRAVPLIALFLLLLAVAAAISMFDLRGRQIPSRLETVIATKVKHWLITWAVYREPPPPPFEAVENPPGEMLFMACCSTMLRKIAISAEGAMGHCSGGGATHSDKGHPMEGMGAGANT